METVNVLVEDFQEVVSVYIGTATSPIGNGTSIQAPQIFNPNAGEVTGGSADFTLSSSASVAFVTLNGQVLSSADYSMSAAVLTVAPYSGYNAITDEVLVFQQS